MINTESGLFAVNVNGMVEMLSRAYVALILHGAPLKSFPSVMLWGPPGVGKSKGVREVAGEIERKTGKSVRITDVRLLLFNPVDLRGIPTANADKTLAIWLKPKIFEMDESDDTVNILFLDEISAAPPSVQASAYQITLDRAVGEHKLPDNCIVIAAGNRVSDRSVAYNMPRALANRLCHFEIKGDPDSWHEWAVGRGLHEYVVGYLEYNSAALMKTDPSSTSVAFPTPRSWEMVSNILNNVSSNIDEVYPMIVGCIGFAAASGFVAWTELYKTMPSMLDIFEGCILDVPKSEELRIALRSCMVAFARKNPDRVLINNSIEYACRLPWTFRQGLLRDYLSVSDLRPIVEKNSVYKTAVKDGRL